MTEPDVTTASTTAELAYQSFANSVAIAVSDATAALRNVQAIMTAAQGVAMARWLQSGQRDEAAQQIVQTATQITRDTVRLWQEVQATAQALVDRRPNAEDLREARDQSADQRPVPRKLGKKAARTPAKAIAAKKAGRKPAKPAAKKAPAKRAKPAKGAAKPRKPRAAKPAPPADATPPSGES